MTKEIKKVTVQEALEYHCQDGKPGKIGLLPTKPLLTQRDLSLAYSPGVAFPCVEIKNNPELAYEYTSKANSVVVISNGTAVLGLGNLGALASKPVMEGKAVLLKRFADIDGIDLEVDTQDSDEFINCVKYLGKTWGGINLEDIKAPECFIIEKKLKEIMDIPVFHDDQHGTAIISLAGLINACIITNKKLEELKIVANGAGAAAIASIELLKKVGVPHNNIILSDSNGVIYKGRKEGMNQWKEKHAVETNARTLAEAVNGADVLIGLSVKGAFSKEMIKSMAPNPIIFALANPDPEITPEDVRSVRDDAIMATGRSDYPNQINNVMGFPYIFRGALDTRSTAINDEMKIAAAYSLAELARQAIPEEVLAIYADRNLEFGKEYIIPTPFDPRLIYTVSIAVAKAAMETGVAGKPIDDFARYKKELIARLNPTVNILNSIFEKAIASQKRIIFADGEEPAVIKAALIVRDAGYGMPILVGREERIEEVLQSFKNSETLNGIEVVNAASDPRLEEYIDYLYERGKRKGLLHRDCVRLVKSDRNIFSACMLACGNGDALVAGYTRSYKATLKDMFTVLEKQESAEVFGLSILIASGKTLFISDATVNINPTPEQLAKIAIQTASKAKELGEHPRAAFVSFGNFGSSKSCERINSIRSAIKILDSYDNLEFEYDGEMTVDIALDAEMARDLYPFSKLSGPANILVMPSLDSAHISSKLLKEVGKGVLVGPMLLGFSKPVQIVRTNASVAEIVNMAAIAATN